MTLIYLVEDDEELAGWISDYLTLKQYGVEVFHTGQSAMQAIQNAQPDLLILDGMLPDIDGLDICRWVRQHYTTPILMLTARDSEADEILGLEVGADDFLTKPVRAQRLTSRIQALLRRAGPVAAPVSDDMVRLGGLTVDKAARTATLNEAPVALSSKEFDVLWLLAVNAGQVVSRDELSRALRGFDFDGFDRSTDLCVSRVRRKLGDDGNQPFKIKTVWGKGYQLVKEVW